MSGSGGRDRQVGRAGLVIIATALAWETAVYWPSPTKASDLGFAFSLGTTGAPRVAAILLLPAYLFGLGLWVALSKKVNAFAIVLASVTVPAAYGLSWTQNELAQRRFRWDVPQFSQAIAGLLGAATLAWGLVFFTRTRQPASERPARGPSRIIEVVWVLVIGVLLGVANLHLPSPGGSFGVGDLVLSLPLVTICLLAAFQTRIVGASLLFGAVAADVGAIAFNLLFFGLGSQFFSTTSMRMFIVGTVLSCVWWAATRAGATTPGSEPITGVPPRTTSSTARLFTAVFAVMVVAATALLVVVNESRRPVSETRTTAAPLDAVEIDGRVGSPKMGGSATVGIPHPTQSLDPTGATWDRSDLTSARALFDPLVAFDIDLQPQPYLARGMEHNEDFTEWTIRLRSGVTFHDGSPLDAAAVKANLDAQRRRPASIGLFTDVDRIEVAGNDAVVVATTKPWLGFPNLLSGQVGMIAAPAMLNPGAGNALAVGSGPFQWTPTQPVGDVLFERNPRYWQASLPRLDRVRFVVEPDPARRWQRMQAGELDGAVFPELDEIETLTDPSGSKDQFLVFSDAALEAPVISLSFSYDMPPFDDADARLAMSLAIDRERLSSEVFQGAYPTASGRYTPSPALFGDLAVGASLQHDATASRAAAERYRTAHGNAPTFTLEFTDERLSPAAQLLQAEWELVGVAVILVRAPTDANGRRGASPQATLAVTPGNSVRADRALALAREAVITVWNRNSPGAFSYALPGGGQGIPTASTFVSHVWRAR